jgi:glycosyltransferase involved in cell wall biosynthesis
VEKRKIKVAIYAATCPPRGGGIATAHYNLYLMFRQHYHVKVFAFNDERRSKDSEIVRLKSPQIISKICRFIVRRYIRKFDQYGEINYSYWISSIAFSVFMLNVQLRRFAPDFIIMPDNFVPAYFVRKPKKSKLIWMSHHNYKRFMKQYIVHSISWMDVTLAHSMERRALQKADFVICPSKYM